MKAILLLVSLMISAAGAAAPRDFAYGNRLTPDNSASVYATALPIDVYRYSARRDLGDLRVFNADGTVVPYAIRIAPATIAPPRLEPVPLFPVRLPRGVAPGALRLHIDANGSSTAIDVATAQRKPDRNDMVLGGYLLDLRRIVGPVRALNLRWPDRTGDFSAAIRVEQSDDLVHWRVINSAAPVAHLRYGGQVLEQSRVELPANAYHYLRITTPENEFPLTLAAIDVEHADVAPPKRHWLPLALTPDPSQAGAFFFTLPGQVPADQLRIDLPLPNTTVAVELSARRFQESTWVRRAAGAVYRLNVAGRAVTSAPISLMLSGEREWRLRFLQPEALKDTTPTVAVGWSPAEVVFLAQGRPPFLLAYGNVDAALENFPVNDILGGVRNDIALAVTEIGVGATETLGGDARRDAPPPREWTRVALWIAIGIGVLLLGAMAWRLWRDLKAQSRS